MARKLPPQRITSAHRKTAIPKAIAAVPADAHVNNIPVGGPWYEVERIVAHKIVKKVKHYRVCVAGVFVAAGHLGARDALLTPRPSRYD